MANLNGGVLMVVLVVLASCDPGKYCNSLGSFGSIDGIDGACNCRNGFKGFYCEIPIVPCPRGTYGLQGMDGECKSCDHCFEMEANCNSDPWEGFCTRNDLMTMNYEKQDGHTCSCCSEYSDNDGNFQTVTLQQKDRFQDDSSSSWAKLEVSDHVIGHMDSGDFSTKIYDHASNKDPNTKKEDKKYFFEPLGLLNHLSAKSVFNRHSKKNEMIFEVIMWGVNMRNAVHDFISNGIKRAPVNIELVRVLPLDRVMAFSEDGRDSLDYHLEQAYILYKGDKNLKFKFICEYKETCDELATLMKENPESFNLKMRFSLSSQKSQSKETKIRIDSILNGDMMNELDQKFHGTDIVLLTADGKKKLLKESSENVIIHTIDDTQVPSTNSRNEIYRMVEKILAFTRTTIQKGDEMAWENVLWNNDNYRPDKSSKSLNELYEKLDKKNQQKLASSFNNTTKWEAGLEGSGWGFTASAKLAAEFSNEGTGSKESLERLLDESKSNVEWNGSKFVPKQMELFSLNKGRFKHTNVFQDYHVMVSYTTSMLTIDVRYSSSADIHSLRDKLNAPGTLPSSCADLSEIGHYLNGIYMIANKFWGKIQAVNCKFGPSGTVTETLIGSLDVKTKNVYFSTHRSDTIAKFQNHNLVSYHNLGWQDEYMNEKSGIFTAPLDGLYHLQYAISDFNYYDSNSIRPKISVSLVRFDEERGRLILIEDLQRANIIGSFATYLHMRAGTQVIMILRRTGQVEDINATLSGCFVKEDLKLK